MDIALLLQAFYERSKLPVPAEPVLVSVRRPFEDDDGPRLRTRSTSLVLGAEDEEQVSVYPLRKSEVRLGNFHPGITVGRAEGNDIVIPDGSISRLHGYFVWDKKRRSWRLFDAESRNGSWLNDVRVPPNVPSAPSEGELLSDGAWIRFGKVDMMFLMPETVARHLGAS